MSHLYALLMNRLNIFISCPIPLLPKDMSSRVYFKLFLLLQMAESISNLQILESVCRGYSIEALIMRTHIKTWYENYNVIPTLILIYGARIPQRH